MSQTRPSSRTRILDTALDLFRAQEPISLESVARAASLTKPGLMYHFPTKEALMTALVDHVFDRSDRRLQEMLCEIDPDALESRLLTYAEWMVSEIDPADLIVFADPRLSRKLMACWCERIKPWVDIPADVSPERRARLLTVRATAEGIWFAGASGMLPLSRPEIDQVLLTLRALLDERD